MGTNQESSDMLKDAVKETFGNKDPVEAMKEINPKVPQHIEDPALAEALLGHTGQKMHSEQSIGDDDDDTEFFSQSSDESLLADVSERKEESKKAGAKIEEGSPSNEKTVGEDMTPRGFILSDEASVSSHPASLTQSSELQVW